MRGSDFEAVRRGSLGIGANKESGGGTFTLTLGICCGSGTCTGTGTGTATSTFGLFLRPMVYLLRVEMFREAKCEKVYQQK